MKAVVLCGGRGQRLRPYTDLMPKPMLPIGDKPILEYVIRNLKLNGISDLILAVGYKGDMIIDYFGDGSKFGVSIEYEREDKPRNTAGALLPLKDRLSDPFLLVMADQMMTVNIRDMIEYHNNQKPIATIGVVKKREVIEYGVVESQDSRVIRFREKPMIEYDINTAIYVLSLDIINFINEGEDISKHVLPRVIEEGHRVLAYPLKGFWRDIGRVADYEEAKRVIEFSEMHSILFNHNI